MNLLHGFSVVGTDVGLAVEDDVFLDALIEEGYSLTK
jgi:hypothetical protein